MEGDDGLGKNKMIKKGIKKLTLPKVEKIPMRIVEELNEKAGRKWFSAGAVSFFNSRWGRTAYKKGKKAYFISSEKSPWGNRKYTIRTFDFKTKIVGTLGDFNVLTEKQAKALLFKYLGIK